MHWEVSRGAAVRSFSLREIVAEIPRRIIRSHISDMCERENTFANEKRDRGRDRRG